MAPVCESHHRLGSLVGAEDESSNEPVEVSTCRWCGAVLPKRSSLLPKNTSTYHRPPLRTRPDILDKHPRLLHRSGDEFTSDSGDNTTVIIGSVVGVVFLVLALGLMACCCMAARKKGGKKKPKDKNKPNDKGKKPKGDKDDPPYRGQPCGTYQQVQDWINYHPGDYSLAMPQMPPFAYQGGFGGPGRQPGMGNEMDAPQMGYGGGWGNGRW